LLNGDTRVAELAEVSEINKNEVAQRQKLAPHARTYNRAQVNSPNPNGEGERWCACCPDVTRVRAYVPRTDSSLLRQPQLMFRPPRCAQHSRTLVLLPLLVLLLLIHLVIFLVLLVLVDLVERGSALCGQ